MIYEALLNEPVALSEQWYDSSEDASNPGTVTVDVYREDGTQLVTDGVTVGTGTSPRTYTVAKTYTTQQDILKVVWTADNAASKVTYIEIFRNYLVELSDIRGEPDIDTTNYSTAKLKAARRWFTDLAQNHCNYSFIPRYGSEFISGRGHGEIRTSRLYVRELLSVTKEGTAVTFTDWDIWSSGRILSDVALTRGFNNYFLSYTHGLDFPDHEVKLAALDAIRDWLISDRAGIEARTISQTNQYMGTTRYSLAGKDKPTGIPHVDSVLNDRRRNLVLF